MTNTWLMRRAVRRPVSLRTTWPISSSVCRLPFIRMAGRAAAHQFHTLYGGGMAVRHIQNLKTADIDTGGGGGFQNLALGPSTRIGSIRPCPCRTGRAFPATPNPLDAPLAVRTGGCCAAMSISFLWRAPCSWKCTSGRSISGRWILRAGACTLAVL